MFFNKQNGNVGESLAYNYLKQNGYKVIDRNYKTRFGEIDIVALKEQTLVFVEVKARSTEQFGTPQEAVNKRKQQTIKTVAMCYLKQKNLIDKVDVRFDCIAINGSKENDFEINHLENVF